MNESSTAISLPADRMDSTAASIAHNPAASAALEGATLDLERRVAGPPTARSAASPVDDRASVTLGRVLRDRYVLEKRLGSGGMGTVFKALDRYRSDLPEANRYVAIKILHQKSDDRVELLDNLRREFYCTQMLSHRNIIKVYELDRDGDLDFFTMELLEGELLSSVTERLHPLPMSRAHAWAIIREIGAGLAHAHARNVVHTDLKPHNIMITSAGEVRILDFGASSTSMRQGSDVLSRRNALSAITPAYACCELLAGRSADPRDDIYAFACIAYELLAGSHPFQRRPSTVARDLGVVPQRPPGLSGRQWRALQMGLSWHRAGRSVTAQAWLDRMHAARAAAKKLPRPAVLESTPPKPAGSLRVAGVFAVLLIGVAAAVSIMHVPPPGGSGTSRSAAVAAIEAPAVAAPAESSVQNGMPSDAVGGGAGTVSQAAGASKRDASRAHPLPVMLSPIVVTARNYRIHTGENFAEIRVHRTSQSRHDAAFVWWTEAASAKPGIDYVHQGKVVQTIPRGKDTASFFIKLVPSASRNQREVFYVAIAESGTGAAQVARAAVWLPTTNDHS